MAAGLESSAERAAREATDWLIFLEDAPNDAALRARFAVWLAADAANKRAWDETIRAYDLIGPAASAENAPVRAVAATAHRARAAIRRPIIARRMAAGAVGAALAACCVLAFAPGPLLHWRADYVTGTGQQRTVHLADGTAIQLGAGSAIAVDDSGARRQVRLLSGRAFFEVTHDARRPFAVLVHGVRATDLGTGFEVAMDADGAEVAVTHGAVRVDDDAAPSVSERLGPGQWAHVSWAGQSTLGRRQPGEIAAWRRGQLIASNTPVTDVVDQLRPYFGGMIVLADNDFARRRVTGVYDLHNPAEALRALAQARPGVAVHRITPWLLVISGT